ncbi:MAG: hypothetical protein LBQ47_09145 [Endomicrobium sp.]|nr:hypothetical protein [Endomicrobium sp.]
MNVRIVFWTLTVAVMIFIVAFNARSQFKSAQNNQKEQTIENAYVKITAPELENKTLNEKSLKESLGENAEKVSVYGVFARKTEYSVIYVKYGADFNLSDLCDKVISVFSAFDLQAQTNTDSNKMTVSGTFKRNNFTYGVEAALYKRGKNSWQALTVFQMSEENLKTARDFIDSIIIDPLGKLPDADAEPAK